MRPSLLSDAKQTAALLVSLCHYRENEQLAEVVKGLSQEEMWACFAYMVPALLQHVYNQGEKLGLDAEESIQRFCMGVMQQVLCIDQ